MACVRIVVRCPQVPGGAEAGVGRPQREEQSNTPFVHSRTGWQGGSRCRVWRWRHAGHVAWLWTAVGVSKSVGSWPGPLSKPNGRGIGQWGAEVDVMLDVRSVDVKCHESTCAISAVPAYPLGAVPTYLIRRENTGWESAFCVFVRLGVVLGMETMVV
jgi:hypothetical protein